MALACFARKLRIFGLLALALGYHGAAYAAVELPVVLNQNSKWELSWVHFPNLEGGSRLELENMVVLNGEQNDEIALFTPNKALSIDHLDAATPEEIDLLRGATVLYHFIEARKFYEKWAREFSFLPNGHIEALRQPITLRINVQSQWSPSLHFKKGSEPLSNTAVTVGPSPTSEVITTPWNSETWFYRSKRVSGPSLVSQSFKSVRSKDSRNKMLSVQAKSLLINTISFWNGNGDELLSRAITGGLKTAALLAAPEAVYQAGKLKKRHAELDTALIPEIIAHESAHHWMSSIFGYLRNPNAISEGYANYFAGHYIGQNSLVRKSKKNISLNQPTKKADRKRYYELKDDSGRSSRSGEFVWSILHAIEEALPEQAGQAVILRTLLYLPREPKIREDLVPALIRACGPEKEDLNNKILVRNVLKEFGL